MVTVRVILASDDIVPIVHTVAVVAVWIIIYNTVSRTCFFLLNFFEKRRLLKIQTRAETIRLAAHNKYVNELIKLKNGIPTYVCIIVTIQCKK